MVYYTTFFLWDWVKDQFLHHLKLLSSNKCPQLLEKANSQVCFKNASFIYKKVLAFLFISKRTTNSKAYEKTKIKVNTFSLPYIYDHSPYIYDHSPYIRASLSPPLSSQKDTIWENIQIKITLILLRSVIWILRKVISPQRYWLCSMSILNRPLLIYFHLNHYIINWTHSVTLRHQFAHHNSSFGHP